MTKLQSIVKKLLPKKTADALEVESRQWMLRCPCGAERSVWDAGGIRFAASGNPRRLMKCAACGERTWHKVEKAPPK